MMFFSKTCVFFLLSFSIFLTLSRSGHAGSLPFYEELHHDRSGAFLTSDKAINAALFDRMLLAQASLRAAEEDHSLPLFMFLKKGTWPDSSLWGQSFNRASEINGAPNQTRPYILKQKGIITGFDSYLPGSKDTGDWRFGLAVAYSQSDDRLSTTETGSGDHFQFMPYVSRKLEPFQLRATGLYALHKTKTRTTEREADYDIQTILASGEVGLPLDLPERSLFEPFARLSLGSLFQKSYTEKALSSLSRVKADSALQITSHLGARLQHRFRFFPELPFDDCGCEYLLPFQPYGLLHLQAGWEHLDAQHLGQSPNAMAVSAGLDLGLIQNGLASFSYSGSYANQASSHTTRIGLSFKF